MKRYHCSIKFTAIFLAVLLMAAVLYSMFISSAYAGHVHRDGTEGSCMICFKLQFARSLRKQLMPAGGREMLAVLLTVLTGVLCLGSTGYRPGRNLITDKVRMDR